MKNMMKYFALGLAFAAGSASASLVTFYGADSNALSGANSSAALNNYLDAAASDSLISFQSASNSSGNFSNLTIASGVSLTVTGNVGGGIVNKTDHSQLGGFNVNGGSRWLQLSPAVNSSTGATAVFTFSTAINAFGAFLTDTQLNLPGAITVSFNDGTSQSLGFTKNNASGGVLFFGFTDTGKSFSSVTINTGATSSTHDIFGIDDVHFAAVPPAAIFAAAVPEPASLALALLGFGLIGIAATRHSKTFKQS